MDKKFFERFSMFSRGPIIPFALEKDTEIDVQKYWDKACPSPAKSTYYDERKAKFEKNKTNNWDKGVKHHSLEEEEEADPDWMDFDPSKEKKRFVGHVMEDEQKLREKVLKKKAEQEDRIKKRKEEAAARAK